MIQLSVNNGVGEDLKLTARKPVSFQTALSNNRFALFPTKIGEVGIASIKFWSSKTLFFPVLSALYRDLEDPLRS
jgi:hypothetical protein